MVSCLEAIDNGKWFPFLGPEGKKGLPVGSRNPQGEKDQGREKEGGGGGGGRWSRGGGVDGGARSRRWSGWRWGGGGESGRGPRSGAAFSRELSSLCCDCLGRSEWISIAPQPHPPPPHCLYFFFSPCDFLLVFFLAKLSQKLEDREPKDAVQWSSSWGPEKRSTADTFREQQWLSPPHNHAAKFYFLCIFLLLPTI